MNFLRFQKTEKIILFQPQLSQEELAKINEAQAKIIYDDAKNILKDNQESIKSLTSKADSLFKHLFTVQSALCGLFIWLSKNPESFNKITLLSFAVFLVPVFIYAANFLTPVVTKGINNPPENTLKEKATYTMPTFYICEAVAIQRYAIPFNEGIIKKKVIWLRVMVGTSLLATLLTFLIFLR